MRILIIGQCTLHWGRMEFGNIGNYYIIEPLVRLLHKEFGSGTIINTTFQLSDRFQNDENISVLPMSLYYSWSKDDIVIANRELEIAKRFASDSFLEEETPFIKEVLNSDLIIDFSGDIWGDNANFLGDNRFYVGLVKNRVAQLLGKKTAMICGSPGPFSNNDTLDFAKEVYQNFDVVTNREAISKNLLKDYGFDVSNTHSLVCPSFLFQPSSSEKIDVEVVKTNAFDKNRKTIGFVICGWNFLEGPFDKENRNEKDFLPFLIAVEDFLQKNKDVNFCVFSHSNGFPIPPLEFELQRGRDYPIVKQFEKFLRRRGNVDETRIKSIDNVLNTWDTKGVVGRFDMLISGRVHAAVAGLSQAVPTVIIDYGHEPKAHKLLGFAEVAGVKEFLVDPNDIDSMSNTFEKCWENRVEVREGLNERLPNIKEESKKTFKLLKELFV